MSGEGPQAETGGCCGCASGDRRGVDGSDGRRSRPRGQLRAPRSAVPLVIASGLGSALLVALAMWGLMRPASEHTSAGDAVQRGPRARCRRSLSARPSPCHLMDGGSFFQSVAQMVRQQLATRLLDQAKPTPLPGTENGADPFFSPDGQWFGFAAGGKLKKMPVHGGPVVTVCDAPIFRGGVWTEDGAIVASLDARAGLSRIPAAGGAPQPSHDAGERRSHPSLAADAAGRPGCAIHRLKNHRVLRGGEPASGEHEHRTGHHRDEGRVFWTLHVRLSHLSSSGRALGRAVRPERGWRCKARLCPCWRMWRAIKTTEARQFDVSQTGTIVYRSGKTILRVADRVDGERRVRPTRCSRRPEPYFTPRVSPDGRHLALAWETGNGSDIYAYDMQRDTMSRLTFNARGNRNPVWTPDGTHLVYASDADKAIWWIQRRRCG